MAREDRRDNSFMTEAQMEEAARRRRARRRKDHKLKVAFTTIVILCLVAACAAVYAFSWYQETRIFRGRHFSGPVPRSRPDRLMS